MLIQTDLGPDHVITMQQHDNTLVKGSDSGPVDVL